MINEISDAIRTEIEAELNAIELKHDVEIIFAVESGSRAWGFPSPDSDYDVRFVYVHKPEWYLSLKPGRDVIERPISDELDISGWDLRKALNLLVAANPVLQEWLRSPIRYRWRDDDCKRLLELSKQTGFLAACTYHYRQTLKSHFERDIADRSAISLKKYFYSLRPALALHSLQLRPESVPPMNLQQLLLGLPDDAVPKEEIWHLVRTKLSTSEIREGERFTAIDEYLERWFNEIGKVASSPKNATLRSDAEAFFRNCLIPNQRPTHARNG
ncbi:MAG: nucleotidyltransferase domain-containing protein [Pseudomonadota bacterium]